MDDTEIITRDDNTQKAFLSEDAIDVFEILHQNYPYILKSVEDENFILKYDQCNLFKELLYENKVVGFCSYDFSREFLTVALNNIYVLPSFRGNKLFFNELKNTMSEHNKPSIMEPTRLIVELLIKYGFAVKINENIVASGIEFVIPGEHVLSNTDYHNEELSTHFYDLSVSSCIHILNLEKDHIAYSSPLNYDIIHYDNVCNIDDEYINDLTDFFKNNEVELMNSILTLEENLPIINYTLEDVIGRDGEFSLFIESLISDAHITESEAFKIKEQIKEEYEAGMILNESLLIRLAYLFNEKAPQITSSHDDVCPYCFMPVDSHDRYCHFCGINLEYNIDDVEKSLFNSINEGEIKEDIRFIAFKFFKLIQEGVDLDYAIITVEKTFDIEWSMLNTFLEDNLYFKNSQITPEGLEFFLNHPLYFWQKYHLEIINYDDFERYFDFHRQCSGRDNCLNYLAQFSDDKEIREIIKEIQNDSEF